MLFLIAFLIAFRAMSDGHARAREEQKQHLLTFGGVIPPNCLTFSRCLDDASLSQVRCFLFSSAMHMCGMPAGSLCVLRHLGWL